MKFLNKKICNRLIFWNKLFLAVKYIYRRRFSCSFWRLGLRRLWKFKFWKSRVNWWRLRECFRSEMKAKSFLEVGLNVPAFFLNSENFPQFKNYSPSAIERKNLIYWEWDEKFRVGIVFPPCCWKIFIFICWLYQSRHFSRFVWISVSIFDNLCDEGDCEIYWVKIITKKLSWNRQNFNFFKI